MSKIINENWDWIRSFYLDHLKQGIPLVQVDEMDIGFYFELMNFDSGKEAKEKVHYIDQVLF